MSGPDESRLPDDRPTRQVRTRTVAVIGFALLGLFLVLLTIGVIPRFLNHRELTEAARSAQNTIPRVFVIKPVRASKTGLTIAATTQATPDAIVYARTTGYVSKRYVDIGDRVKAGQLLAEIESPEVDQQLRQARADLQQSERNLDLQRTNLSLARITMERYLGADAEGAVAKELLDQSIAGFHTAEAAVAAALANVKSNGANVRRLQELASFEGVRAPFDGKVIQRTADVGTLITAGSPINNIAVAPTSVGGGANGLFEIGEIEHLRVFVNVPQPFAPNVSAGLPVTVTVRGQLMQPVTATVTRTSGALDPASRTLLAQVDIPNKSHHLLPGMFVYVSFTIGPSGTRWRIPSTAVLFDAKGTRVVVVDGRNRLSFRPVEVGRDFGAELDIQAGLDGSETIVKQPAVSLEEGEEVVPVEAQENG